jgi:chromosome segregation ATPase
VSVDNALQLGNDIKELEKRLEDIKEAIATAQAKQKEAQADCKKLEKDMNEFKTNKDGKLKQLKVRADVRVIVGSELKRDIGGSIPAKGRAAGSHD